MGGTCTFYSAFDSFQMLIYSQVAGSKNKRRDARRECFIQG